MISNIRHGKMHSMYSVLPSGVLYTRRGLLIVITTTFVNIVGINSVLH